ncbi:PLD nuclease N-terminal domain-containing protein [Streptomyces sp. PR69]|uniref:PLD nuclease N-terminal domain-containing protein n=1 Tax=Streptomyces sp. PR69 TaxID=2984950 RepID=UPI002264DA81|nr:PLDc N-terminal domain-containing protein [Streptomyces sp. PR69]
MLRALMFLVPLALTIYAFIDCLNTPEDEAKHLPKIAWVFIILLFWIVGPVVWLAAGKTRRVAANGRTPSEWHRGRRPKWVAPDDNPEFLQSLRDEKQRQERPRKSNQEESEQDEGKHDEGKQDERREREQGQGEDPKQP